MKRALLSIIAAIVATATALSASSFDYKSVSKKAERYFGYEEWNSALAMYELIIDNRPLDIPSYYKAIVSSGMLGNKDTQIDLLQRTQKQGIALDSIFKGVKDVSFSIGEGRAYEGFLLLVRERQPWIARSINAYLLDYYTFRNDAPSMIAIAKQLLATTPDNLTYIRILAKAYVMDGHMDDAVKCYKQIVEKEPNDYDALLSLGIYYKRKADNATAGDIRESLSLAEDYLNKANKLDSTPYVENLLSDLRNRMQ